MQPVIKSSHTNASDKFASLSLWPGTAGGDAAGLAKLVFAGSQSKLIVLL